MCGPDVPDPYLINPGSIYQYAQPGAADAGAAAGVQQLGSNNVAQNLEPAYRNMLQTGVYQNPERGYAMNTAEDLSNLESFYQSQATQNPLAARQLQGASNYAWDPNNAQNQQAYSAASGAYTGAANTQNLAGNIASMMPYLSGLGQQVAGSGQGAASNIYGQAGQAAGYGGAMGGAGATLMGEAPWLYGLGNQTAAQAGNFYGAADKANQQGNATAGYASQVAGTAPSFMNQSYKLISHANPLYAQGDSLAPYAQQALIQGFDPQQDYYKQQQQLMTDQTRATLAAQGLGTSVYGSQVENKANQDFNIAFGNNQLMREQLGAGTANALLGEMGNLYGQGANQIMQGLSARDQSNAALMQAGSLRGQAAGDYATGAGIRSQGVNAATSGANIYNLGNNTVQGAASDYAGAGGLAATAGGLFGQGASTGANMASTGAGIYGQAAGLGTQAGSLYGQAGQLGQVGTQLNQSVLAQQIAAAQAALQGRQSAQGIQSAYGTAATSAGQNATSMAQAPYLYGNQMLSSASNNGILANQSVQQQIADMLLYLQGSQGANQTMINAANMNNSANYNNAALGTTQSQNLIGNVSGGIGQALGYLGF